MNRAGSAATIQAPLTGATERARRWLWGVGGKGGWGQTPNSQAPSTTRERAPGGDRHRKRKISGHQQRQAIPPIRAATVQDSRIALHSFIHRRRRLIDDSDGRREERGSSSCMTHHMHHHHLRGSFISSITVRAASCYCRRS